MDGVTAVHEACVYLWKERMGRGKGRETGGGVSEGRGFSF